MIHRYLAAVSIWMSILLLPCCSAPDKNQAVEEKIPVILDTDANNELDDQHALAYLLCNQAIFDIQGITVNATWGGGLIQGHYDEALRILKLFNEQALPLKRGADKTFCEIREEIGTDDFDGKEAADFIIEKAKECTKGKLVVIAIGKLTNIALAVEKSPDISGHIRLVWLGSNYPDPGEYNLENDTSALAYLLKSNIHFEMVTVSYGRLSGTDFIKVSVPEIDSVMPGKGPQIEGGIIGRHGGTFYNFGDYSVNLFHHIDVYGDPPSRALFDVGAVAVVKDNTWSDSVSIGGLNYTNNQWIRDFSSGRKIILWQNFNRDLIINDFYQVLDESE